MVVLMVVLVMASLECWSGSRRTATLSAIVVVAIVGAMIVR